VDDQGKYRSCNIGGRLFLRFAHTDYTKYTPGEIEEGEREKMSDAILDLKEVNGIPVKLTLSHVDSTWMICANGTDPIVSFRLHQGDYSDGKNGCDVDDILKCLIAHMMKLMIDRECFRGDPAMIDAVSYLRNSVTNIEHHREHCWFCNPDLQHG
jgi:hypothetical protein